MHLSSVLSPIKHGCQPAGRIRARLAGEMNDAGEVLLTLYESTISTGAAAESAVNAIFGLPVEEQVGGSWRLLRAAAA